MLGRAVRSRVSLEMTHERIHAGDHRDARAANVLGLTAREHDDALDGRVDEATAREIAKLAPVVKASGAKLE